MPEVSGQEAKTRRPLNAIADADGAIAENCMQTFLSNSLPLLQRLATAYGVTLSLPAPQLGTRLSTDLYDRACAQLAGAISDPAFGLRAAQLWHPSDFATLGYAWFASSTLREALQRLVRYSRILGERGRIELQDDPAGLWLRYEHRRADPLLDRIGSEIILSVILALCRRNYGERLNLQRACLSFPAPELRAPYDAFFGCEVEFDAGFNALQISHAAADRELPTANLEVAGTLDELLTRQLAGLDRSDFVARSKAALLETIAGGLPEARDIARRLCVSERTLQRRLAQRHTSFHTLVDETRRELATAYLDDAGNSVTEVAFLVGFATPSAFSRAFTRWTGCPPSEWRRRSTPSAQAQGSAGRMAAG